MILEWIRFGLCAACLFTAMICFTAAVLGANRFGFIMNRLHAAGIGDTLGIFLVALSILIGDGLHMQEIKMLMILVFMAFTSPVSSHFLTQLEYFTNPHLYSYVKREGLDGYNDIPEGLNSPESTQEAVSGQDAGEAGRENIRVAAEESPAGCVGAGRENIRVAAEKRPAGCEEAGRDAERGKERI